MSARLVVLLLCCLTAVAGCSRTPEEKAAAHRTKASKYLKVGKLDEAVLELRSALQAAPNDKTTLLQLGEAFIKKGQFGEAFQAFRKVAELDPKNVDAQVRLGSLYILANKPEEAQKCADIVAAAAPNRADGHMLNAKLRLREGKPDEAFKEFDRAVELEPGNLENRLVGATVLLSVGKIEQARKAVDEVLVRDPASVPGLLLLAQTAEVQKDPKGAEDAFARLLTTKPKDPSVWVTYGNFWLTRGDEKKAIEAYQKAGEVDKSSTAGLERLGEYYLSKPDLAAVKKVVADIRSRAKKNVAATYFEARIALAERKLDDAVAKFNEVLKQYPNRADVHYFLARVYYTKQNLPQARAEAAKAVELQPGLVMARILLGQIHMDLREYDLALKQTDDIFKQGRVPGEAVFLRASALVAAGRPSEGRELMEKTVAALPISSPAQERLGVMYLAENKTQKALESFARAVDLDPRNLSALSIQVQVLASQKKVDEAIGRVESQIRRAGDSAAAREILGQLCLEKRDAARATREFQRAVELDPNAVGSYLALAGLHQGPDARQKALADVDRALARQPGYLQAWMARGALLDQLKRTEEANQAYRKALEIKPDLVPALNNLAWNISEHGGNLEEALKFAEKAVELAPKSPSTCDTLGWIYVKKGVYLKALEYLETAAAKMPDNPAALYHLGAAYAGKGDSKKAVATLEKALKLSTDFPGAADARKLLEKSRVEVARR